MGKNVWWWMMTGKNQTLPTIWEIPDDLWKQIHLVILEMDPPRSTGRKRVHPRSILDGITIPDAYRLPLGPPAQATGGRQHHSS